VLIHLAPGDPVSGTLDDPRVPEAVRQHWRHVYGLDRPIAEQYVRYVVGVARGDFGYSIAHAEPVRAVLARALPNTVLLAGIALFASFAAGIAIGVVQAMRRGSLADHALNVWLLGVYSIPDFWLAQLAILILAYWVPIFPVGGVVDPILHPYLGEVASTIDRLRHLILPALTLAILATAPVARFQRSALLDVSAEDYLRTARAKGLSERSVMLRHALRNALLPIITLFGLALPAFLGGQVFVEKVFSWPGLGAAAVDAVNARDYAVVVACAIVTSALVAVGSATADVLYALADPRVRGQDARPSALPFVGELATRA
jgi:peptide/nickel transport system permease protein